MMIYCKLKENNDNSAIYLFGTDIDDITGEAEFYSSFTQPKILKHPQTGDVANSLLSKIVVKYTEDLLKGKFPDKMSYER